MDGSFGAFTATATLLSGALRQIRADVERAAVDGSRAEWDAANDAHDAGLRDGSIFAVSRVPAKLLFDTGWGVRTSDQWSESFETQAEAADFIAEHGERK